MSDHAARRKQLSDMHERTKGSPINKSSRSSTPPDMFFDVFCNHDKYTAGETTDTIGRNLECIEQAMGDFWTIHVAKKQPNAKIPTKAHKSDAGWDLYSCEPKTILPNERVTINTGISLAIPNSFAGLIWPRSGLAVKQGVVILAGVIDSGYRGEVKVCLLNTGQDTIIIDSGDRIAQILFQEVPKFRLVSATDLNETERNSDGFGSSGS